MLPMKINGIAMVMVWVMPVMTMPVKCVITMLMMMVMGEETAVMQIARTSPLVGQFVRSTKMAIATRMGQGMVTMIVLIILIHNAVLLAVAMDARKGQNSVMMGIKLIMMDVLRSVQQKIEIMM